MYDEFISKGWQSSEIHIFVKPSRMTDVDRGLCDTLEKIGKAHIDIKGICILYHLHVFFNRGLNTSLTNLIRIRCSALDTKTKGRSSAIYI